MDFRIYYNLSLKMQHTPKMCYLGQLELQQWSLLSQNWLSSDPGSVCSDHTVWHGLHGEHHYLRFYMLYIRNNCVDGAVEAVQKGKP
jgi:hypothetical protein